MWNTVHQKIVELKKEACNNIDNPIADLFFNQLNEIKDEETAMVCEVDQDNMRIYIHLPEALRTLNNFGYHQPSSQIRAKELRECTAFIVRPVLKMHSESRFKHAFS